jgi:hypothetical protein
VNKKKQKSLPILAMLIPNATGPVKQKFLRRF